MEKILRYTESSIWDFPKIILQDDSIIKRDNIKIYEDSHGAGSLKDAEQFSYTTNNEDVWLLPSQSYLLLKFYVKTAADGNYRWVAAGDNAAQVVNLADNGFNLFKEARYYIDDQEVERLDHVGISSLINTMIKNDAQALNSVRDSMMWFGKEEDDRKSFLINRSGRVNLLLPLEKIFPFFEQNQHVFRGVKHRITLTLNSADSILKRTAGVAGKIYIDQMTWIIPQVEPSLGTMAKLENQLAAGSKFHLNWDAISVYKHTINSNLTDQRIALSSTIHKPKHVFVALQTATRQTDQTQDSMIFDQLNLQKMSVQINEQNFPDKPLEFNYNNYDVAEVHQRFLDMCKNHSGPNIEDFMTKWPIYHIDVSKHKPELYDSTSFPNIVINLNFSAAPANPYNVWIIIYNEREATLNLEQKKMRVIR